jgi:ligand-binding sensor domain-containing protein/DNA-binding CsgD family transcriptional regulator
MRQFLLFFILCTQLAYGQSSIIGNLPINNYSKKKYDGGTQNWDVAVSPDGIMYFANNEGLLRYDGVFWKKYPISNQTIVRSLGVAKDRIYVGGQGELGYFAIKGNGDLDYNSLISTIPEKYRGFSDVWDILVKDESILFRTERYVFHFHKEKMSVYDTGGPIHYLGLINDEIYVHDEYKGLLKFTGEKFILPNFTHKPPSPVTAILPYNEDTVLVTTLKDGIYLFDKTDLTPFETPLDDLFKEKSIYSACQLLDGRYVFGITPTGLLFTDEKFQKNRFLGKKEGLQNTNVLALTTDLAGNLWLALDNGIDYVEVNSAYTYIFPDSNLEGTGYTATIFENKLYLGNSNGLYVTPWNDNDEFYTEEYPFKKIKKADGQIWGLHQSKGELLLGMHNGSFQLKNDTALEIPNFKGVWNFLRLDENHIVAGHYQGMAVLRKENGSYRKFEEIEGLEESSRLLVQESQGVLWMSHPYRGVYRVVLNEDYTTKSVKRYGVNDGLPSDNFNHTFKVRNEVVFAGETGIYKFDKSKMSFKAMESYNKLFEEYGRVKMLKEDEDGNIWFMAGETCGRLTIEDNGLDIKVNSVIFPELSKKLVGGFEFAYPYNSNNIFFGAERGFIRFDAQKYAASDFSINAKISEFRLNNEKDSLLHTSIGGTLARDEISLSSDENSLYFAYSANAYRNPEEVRFQTKLKGFSTNWSEWTDKPEKEYINLDHNDYTFMVRARNAAGIVSEVEEVSFSISAPWYLSLFAYFLYGLAIISAIFFGLRKQSKEFEKEKVSLQNQHEQQEKIFRQKAENSELELSRLKRQRLETEVEFKNQELASATLHLVQKREMLAGLKSDLSKLLIKMKSKDARPQDLQKLIRLVERDLENDSEWDQFAHHFDQVHQGFLTRLKEKYPVLSPNDLKLCAYLRMNLSSKEIAPMMAISVRGVEAGRYRLRKKIDLPNDANLRELMMNV